MVDAAGANVVTGHVMADSPTWASTMSSPWMVTLPVLVTAKL